MAFGHTFFYCVIILASFREAYSLIIARDENNITETFFTTELNVFGAAEHYLQGVLVEADPVDACRNISPSHFNLSVGCFVLISEGSCGIEEKIFNAYAAKYSAAIIYHVEAPDIALARRLHSQIPVSPNITVVLVNRHAGSRLAEKFLYTTSPKSRIYIYPSTVFNIFAFLMLFAVVAATFIFTMLLFLIIRCIQQSRQRRRNRLSTRHLRQIPTARYRHGDPYETCAICLEDYKEKDKLRILPCSHGYHCKCIDPWLTNNKRTCPVCKQKVVLPGVHSDEDSSSSDTESRAETTPLIRETVRRPVSHGTFNNSYDIPGINRHSPNALQQASGETTSRDAPSDVLDESSDEEKQVSTIRTCSSAPGTLAFACEEQQPAAADLYAGAPLPPSPSNISCNGAGGDNVCVVSPGSAAGNSSVTKSKHNSFKTYVV